MITTTVDNHGVENSHDTSATWCYVLCSDVQSGEAG